MRTESSAPTRLTGAHAVRRGASSRPTWPPRPWSAGDHDTIGCPGSACRGLRTAVRPVSSRSIWVPADRDPVRLADILFDRRCEPGRCEIDSIGPAPSRNQRPLKERVQPPRRPPTPYPMRRTIGRAPADASATRFAGPVISDHGRTNPMLAKGVFENTQSMKTRSRFFHAGSDIPLSVSPAPLTSPDRFTWLR